MGVIRLVCRTCGAPVTAADDAPLPPGFPFCSERCRTIDLGAWAEGRYRIAGRPAASPSDAPRDD